MLRVSAKSVEREGKILLKFKLVQGLITGVLVDLERNQTKYFWQRGQED